MNHLIMQIEGVIFDEIIIEISTDEFPTENTERYGFLLPML